MATDLSADSARGWLSSSSPGPGTSGRGRCWSRASGGEESVKTGKELYEIYCSVCHGSKGDGQGILMTREKFLGIPSYADRDITEGSIYHVLMYGINLMGSNASQVDQDERWKISQYVMDLRNELKK